MIHHEMFICAIFALFFPPIKDTKAKNGLKRQTPYMKIWKSIYKQIHKLRIQAGQPN